MPAIWSDNELSFGPSAMERPSAFHGTYHIVATLHNHSGDVSNPRSVAQQLVVRIEESLIYEVVRFNARESQSELILSIVVGESGIWEEFGGSAFPRAP